MKNPEQANLKRENVDSWLPGAGGIEGLEGDSLRARGFFFVVSEGTKCFKMYCGGGCTPLNILKTTEWFTWACCMVCDLYLIKAIIKKVFCTGDLTNTKAAGAHCPSRRPACLSPSLTACISLCPVTQPPGGPPVLPRLLLPPALGFCVHPTCPALAHTRLTFSWSPVLQERAPGGLAACSCPQASPCWAVVTQPGIPWLSRLCQPLVSRPFKAGKSGFTVPYPSLPGPGPQQQVI